MKLQTSRITYCHTLLLIIIDLHPLSVYHANGVPHHSVDTNVFGDELFQWWRIDQRENTRKQGAHGGERAGRAAGVRADHRLVHGAPGVDQTAVQQQTVVHGDGQSDAHQVLVVHRKVWIGKTVVSTSRLSRSVLHNRLPVVVTSINTIFFFF